MRIVLVWLAVKQEFLDAFIVATMEMAHASLREDGCRRFEVLRADEQSLRFVLYAAFNSRRDAELHFETEHLAQWNAAVAPMLSEPPQALHYTQLF